MTKESTAPFRTIANHIQPSTLEPNMAPTKQGVKFA